MGNLVSNFNSEKVDKSAYFQPCFDQPFLKGKIDPNIIKIGVHAYLSNGYLKPLSKLNSEKVKNSKKVDKIPYFQPWFDQP